jgi:hypothetical protein
MAGLYGLDVPDEADAVAADAVTAAVGSEPVSPT